MWRRAQINVELSRRALRNSPRTFFLEAATIGLMKNRFPTDHLTPWRQRFVAIARELGEPALRRRESLGAGAGPRTALLARGSLRGIRLGCVRTA
jgi:hypothetical protein